MVPPLIIFLIVLSLLIFVHELGHFLAAKKSGIKVEEFGFGYPPRIWSKKVGKTIYSVNWIPFGGFVKLLGQERGEKKKWSPQEIKQAFFSQSKKAKTAVLLAGIFGNFLFGVFCFSIIYSKIGIPTELDYVKVVEVIKDSPAANVGLKQDDKIISIDGKSIYSTAGFIELIEENKGQEIVLQTSENEFYLMPRENPPEKEGRIGVVITDIEMAFYPFWQMPFRGAWEGLKEAFGWTWMILQGIGLTIKQLFIGITPEVAGPVGIFQLTASAAEQGILQLIQFVGILSINLAVLNFLPFPALDGGHLMFVYIGPLLGKKRREKIEHIVTTAGFILLISLMILVTINDLSRLFKDSPIISFLKSFF